MNSAHVQKFNLKLIISSYLCLSAKKKDVI